VDSDADFELLEEGEAHFQISSRAAEACCRSVFFVAVCLHSQ
jgi:hypothetical protein